MIRVMFARPSKFGSQGKRRDVALAQHEVMGAGSVGCFALRHVKESR